MWNKINERVDGIEPSKFHIYSFVVCLNFILAGRFCYSGDPLESFWSSDGVLSYSHWLCWSSLCRYSFAYIYKITVAFVSVWAQPIIISLCRRILSLCEKSKKKKKKSRITLHWRLLGLLDYFEYNFTDLTLMFSGTMRDTTLHAHLLNFCLFSRFWSLRHKSKVKNMHVI